MKTSIKAIAVMTAAITVLSCQKDRQIIPDAPDAGKLEITLSIEDGTKATDINPDNERKYTSVQFFVFDGAGRLEDYKSVTGSSATLGMLAGTKTFVAVLNASGDLSDAGTLEELNSKITYLKDNSLDHFLMVGSKSQAVSAGCEGVNITVKRLVARISINKITTAFESAALRGAAFTVERIYLINAAGDACIGSSGSPALWYNEKGWHKGSASPAGAADALVADAVSIDLSGNRSHNVSHSFYCYPNSFESLKTVLELDVRINGEPDHYTVDFSSKGVDCIEPNKTYTVEELVIKHRGNDGDGDGDVDGSVSFDCTITIDEWDETGLEPYVETL